MTKKDRKDGVLVKTTRNTRYMPTTGPSVNVVGTNNINIIVSTPAIILKAGSTKEKGTQVTLPRPAAKEEMVDMYYNSKRCEDCHGTVCNPGFSGFC